MTFTSSFFSNTTGYSGEVNLLDDLTREQIKLFGLDIYYLPRKLINLDKLFHENTKSQFEMGLSLPVYVKSFSGYSNMEILSKFGVRSSDDLTLICSRSEFLAQYSPTIKSYLESVTDPSELKTYENKEHLIGLVDQRPNEGDLIYFPFDGGIFEIKYVMTDQPFFQFGTGYTFEMQCEKFEYSGETLNTGINEIDKQASDQEYYRLEFQLEEEGVNTFEFNETVFIYKLEEVKKEKKLDSISLEDFRLFNSEGFLTGVSHITAKVMSWNKPNSTLIVGDLSNQDPTQLNEFEERYRNKLERVLIVGQKSRAVYKSIIGSPTKQALNDEEQIQDEFERIKIVDQADSHPFGFL